LGEEDLPMKLGNFWLILLSICVGLVGCGGPRAQVAPQQIVSQVDSKAKQSQLQEQLLKQVALTSTVTNFKDYKVGPEDLLGISVLGTDKLNTEVRVNGQGEISLLLVGVVKVEGLTTNEIEKKLAHLYKEGDYLRNPQIMISVKEFRHQRVAVTGAVTKPDSYVLIGPRSLLEVLGMAGGLSDRAGEVAHVIRPYKGAEASKAGTARQSFTPGTETIMVDLNRLLLKGDTGLNVAIKNGDVVHIPYAHMAYVLGAVGKPGEVPIKNNMTVTKALAQAGGQHIVLASNNASILRMDENGQRQTIPVNLASITKGSEPDVPLKENDIIYVHESGVRRFLFDFKMFTPGNVGMGIPGLI
jgi:polysaccharide export outer membrane protein